MKNIVKKELQFSLIMTFGMVVIMLTYNMLLHFGWSQEALVVGLQSFVPVYLGAFLIEQFIVDHNVRRVHAFVVSPTDKAFKKVIVFSLLMVTGMVVAMTLFAALLTNTGSADFWMEYLVSVARNFPVALIAQLCIVGPIVRAFIAPPKF